ncbi:acyltransferase [Metabacillus herbersteinensis]|uniref:Acyltransferase n=1 Tax=Metabacillus herbersteinensis TaxID=283816 RepID=A0ABV6GEZ0_9BACI
MNETKRKYIFEIHYLRAIACLLVVLVHVSGIYFYQQGQFNDYTFFVNQIGRFGTPIFALMSGFLLFNQVNNKGFQFKKFLSSRLTKIGLPFLIWSIFYLLIMYYFESANPFMREHIIVRFFLGDSFYHLYFMSLVLQFYLIFPLIQLIRTKIGWFLLLLTSLILNVYFLKYFSLPANLTESWNLFLGDRALLFRWIYFFIFGGFLAYFWAEIHTFAKKNTKMMFLLLIIVVIGGYIEYKVYGSVASNRMMNFINIPILSISFIGLGDYLDRIKIIRKALTLLGSLSMGIYLVHPLVIYSLTKLLPEEYWRTLYFPLIFVVVLLGSILIIKLVQFLPFNQYIITVPKVNGQKSRPFNIPTKSHNVS